MATTTTEESSPPPATVAPQQPDLENSVEPGSAAKPEPSEAQRHREERTEEDEEEDGGQENGRGESLDPEWVEERFRIDRKKLESMLYGEWAEMLPETCKRYLPDPVCLSGPQHQCNCHPLNSCCRIAMIYAIIVPITGAEVAAWLVIAAWQVYDKCLPCYWGNSVCCRSRLMFVCLSSHRLFMGLNSALITVGCFNVCVCRWDCLSSLSQAVNIVSHRFRWSSVRLHLRLYSDAL